MSKKERRVEYKSFFLFTQLGLTVVSPIVLCLFVVLYLKNRWNAPDVVTVLLILIGVGAGVGGALRMLFKIGERIEEKGDDGDESE